MAALALIRLASASGSGWGPFVCVQHAAAAGAAGVPASPIDLPIKMHLKALHSRTRVMTSLMGDKKREYHCEYNNKGSITLLPFFLLFVCIRL